MKKRRVDQGGRQNNNFMDTDVLAEILPTSLRLVDYAILVSGRNDASVSAAIQRGLRPSVISDLNLPDLSAVDLLKSLVSAHRSLTMVERKFVALFDDVFVLPDIDPKIPRDIIIEDSAVDASSSSVQAVLSRLITLAVRSSSAFWQGRNCLALGYRAKSDLQNNTGIRGNIEIECFFVNTLHSILCTSPWQSLTKYFGEAFMLHLFSRPVFFRTENGCFLQLAGTNVGHLIHQRNGSTGVARSRQFYDERCSFTNQLILGLRRESEGEGANNMNIRPNKDANVFDRNAYRNVNPTKDWSIIYPICPVTETARMRGDTHLPRFEVFYKFHYRKMDRFIRDRSPQFWKRLDLEVFGLLKFRIESKNSLQQKESNFVYAVDDPVYAPLKEAIGATLRTSITRYQDLNIHDSLERHCPSNRKSITMHSAGGSGGRASGDVPDSDSDIESIGHKRTRRGCRAGKQRTHKGRSCNARNQSLRCDVSAIESVRNQLISRNTPAKTGKVTSDIDVHTNSSVVDKDICTVGQRIFKRYMNCAILQQNSDGYISQDDSVIDGASPSKQKGSRNHLHAHKPVFTESMAHSQTFRIVGDGFPHADETEAANCDSNLQFIQSNSTQNSGCAHHLDRVLETQTSLDGNVTCCPENKSVFSKKRKLIPDKANVSNDSIENLNDVTIAPINYINLCTPARNVCEFAKSIVRRTFDLSHWGSRYNQSAVLAYVDKYIRLGRNETFTLAQVSKRIRLADIPWMKHVEQVFRSHLSDLCSQEKIRAEIYLAKQQMMYCFMYWLFADFIQPLLCSHFYATEAEGRGNEVLWYRKNDWKNVVDAGLKQMQSHFVQVKTFKSHQKPYPGGNQAASAANASSGNAIIRNYANIRFLPKAKSVRAITNLRPKGPIMQQTFLQDPSGHVSNSALYNCLHVLKCLYAEQSTFAGFGTFGGDEVYEKFLRFRKQVKPTASVPGNDGGKFFVAVMDLEKCYDNVDTIQLFNLVKKLLDDSLPQTESTEESLLHKYSVVYRIASIERAVTKSIRHVSLSGDMFSFDEVAPEISRHYRNSIISDNVVYQKMSKKEILRLLRLHLFSHVVRMPILSKQRCLLCKSKTCLEHLKSDPTKKQHTVQFSTQTKGIPQGSILSPLLCNLYYGYAEEQIFGSNSMIQAIGFGNKTMVVRMMDDYIVVSTDKDAATKFVQTAHSGLRPYGGGVNPSKTRANFDVEVELDGKRMLIEKIRGRNMPWCGFNIDTETLEIKPNVTRMLEKPLRLSTSVESTESGSVLRRAMKSFVRSKCHGIVFDSLLNSYDTVYRNIYMIFIVSAMRTHVCIRALEGFKPSRNPDFIVQCVVEAVLFGARLIHSRTQLRSPRKLSLGSDGYESTSVSALTALNKGINNEDLLEQYQRRTSKNVSSSRCEVTRRLAVWLGFVAFHATFSCRHGLYFEVLRSLRGKILVLEGILQKKANRDLIASCDQILHSTKNWL